MGQCSDECCLARAAAQQLHVNISTIAQTGAKLEDWSMCTQLLVDHDGLPEPRRIMAQLRKPVQKRWKRHHTGKPSPSVVQ